MISKFSKKIKQNSDKYVIFYSNWCGYSMEAISHLKGNNIRFKGYNIDKIRGKMDKLLEKLNDDKNVHSFNSNHKTRPLIFKYGQFLGGFDELVKVTQ
jgi:hypothetical protein